jgi:phosphoglucomutase
MACDTLNLTHMTQDLIDKIQKYYEWQESVDEKKALFRFLVQENASRETLLKTMFMAPLSFGTAGLREKMAPGFNRINMVTIMQVSQALCTYLIKKYGETVCAKRGIIIGYDGRHFSKFYAHLVAAVFLCKKFKVYLNSKVTPTPFNPFSVLYYQCVAGCQITASHNPKEYNGCKIYTDRASQMTPPMEDDLLQYIHSLYEPWKEAIALMDFENLTLKSMKNIYDPYEEILDNYMIRMTQNFLKTPQQNFAYSLPLVYTPLHGVGGFFIKEGFKKFGYDLTKVHFVEDQQEIDPNFSTVRFPNPEETGALDMSINVADKINAKIVLANDPDVDRFACCEKQKDGQWKTFTGNELGIIFAAEHLKHLQNSGVPCHNIFFISSIVSSRMLKKLCEVEGCLYEETMTGFKWMVEKAHELWSKGLTLGLIYEEALGFALHSSVPDKDGISSLCFWIQMLADLHKKGMTVSQKLDDLRNKYGYFAESNSYFTYKDSNVISEIFKNFRQNQNYKTHVGPYKISRIRDITLGYDSGEISKICRFPKTPSSQNITIFFDNEAVVTLRTSGTEPKLKYYAEINGNDMQTAQQTINSIVDAVVTHIIQPEKYGLIAQETK